MPQIQENLPGDIGTLPLLHVRCSPRDGSAIGVTGCDALLPQLDDVVLKEVASNIVIRHVGQGPVIAARQRGQGNLQRFPAAE